MKVYIAAPFAAQAVVDGFLLDLERIGFERQCRWAQEEPPEGALGLDADGQRAAAHLDLSDIASSDVLVLLTPRIALAGLPNTVSGEIDYGWSEADLAYATRSGGRLVEMGYALGRNIPVVVVGEPDNIFAHLPQVTIVPSWHVAVLHLAAMLVNDVRSTPRIAEGPPNLEGLVK